MYVFSFELNARMKIFSQLYVGLKDQGADRPKLGFATPLEKGAAFEKRKGTVDRWASVTTYNYETRKYSKPTLETATVDNSLREGFRVTDDVRRVYWGGGNVVWRVMDPAGFELEIPSSNLMALIQVSGVGAGGEIPGRCIWGRDGSTNILLHEKSDVYMNAIKNAEDIKRGKELAAKSRVVGGKYVMQNGSTCVYLGTFQVATRKTHVVQVDEHRKHSWDRVIEHKEIVVDLPSGGYSFGEQRTHSIEDAGMYDAIQILYTDDTVDTGVEFYRKAPLIGSTGDGEALTNEECELRVKNAVRWRFAGNSKKDPIIYAARKFGRPLQFVLGRMTDSAFAEVQERAERIAKENHAGFSSLFYRYGALPLGYVTEASDTVLWSAGGSKGHYHPKPAEEFILPATISPTEIIAVACEYARDYPRFTVEKDARVKAQPAPVKKLAVEWLQEMRSMDLLKEVFVVEQE